MSQVATVYIDGEILPENYIWPEEQATSLYRVRQQIEAAGEFDAIQLNIFSPGGYCLEGWAIVDYLLSLGKPINTYTYGQCASFATIFHLMGSERLISPNCQYMIHLPWDFFVGNYKENEVWSDSLKKESRKVIDYYAKGTGLEAAVVDGMMVNDCFMTPQETVDKNFSTAISIPGSSALARQLDSLKLAKPVCFFSLKDRRVNPNAPKNLTPKPINAMAEKKKTLIDAAKSFLAQLSGEQEPKALDVPLKDGSKIITNSTGDMPVIGDTATLADGTTAPDGTYTMENGTVLTVKDGVITNVVESDDTSTDSAAAEPEAVAALRTEVAELKNQIKARDEKYDQLEKRITPGLTALLSQDVPMQANRQPGNGRSAELSDREKMLAEHVAKYAPKTATA